MDKGDSEDFPLVLKITLIDAMVENVGQRWSYWRCKYGQQFALIVLKQFSWGYTNWFYHSLQVDVVSRNKRRCALCLNHQIESFYQGGHKNRCIYANCQCCQCLKTKQKQKLTAELTAMTRKARNELYQKKKPANEPTCRRCVMHFMTVMRKGHECPFEMCNCTKCDLLKRTKVIRKTSLRG